MMYKILDRVQKYFGLTTKQSQYDDILDNEDIYDISAVILASNLARVDGLQSKEEFETLINKFSLDNLDKQTILSLWKSEKSGHLFAKKLGKKFAKKPEILEEILNNLFYVAEADGDISRNEKLLLKMFANDFGISDQKFKSISINEQSPEEEEGKKRSRESNFIEDHDSDEFDYDEIDDTDE